MKEKLTVIKVGGKIVEEPETLNQLLADFSAIEGYKVLVHGGGRSATKLAAQLGIESKMVNGRRITDAETLKVVTMVYGGLVNKNIVAGLQAKGVNAMGLTGADMNVIRSVKRPVKDVALTTTTTSLSSRWRRFPQPAYRYTLSTMTTSSPAKLYSPTPTVTSSRITTSALSSSHVACWRR